MNKDQLLRAVVRYAGPEHILQYTISLLSQQADAGYREDEDSAATEAFAYMRTTADSTNPADIHTFWRVFALLINARALFDATKPAWRQKLSVAICQEVERVRRPSAGFYQNRDGGLVQSVLTYMALSLCTGAIDRQIIQSHWLFVQLNDIWRYLSSPVPTVQLATEIQACPEPTKHQRAPALVPRVSAGTLQQSLLNLVVNIFSRPEYKGLQGKDILIRRLQSSLVSANRENYSGAVAEHKTKERINRQGDELCRVGAKTEAKREEQERNNMGKEDLLSKKAEMAEQERRRVQEHQQQRRANLDLLGGDGDPVDLLARARALLQQQQIGGLANAGMFAGRHNDVAEDDAPRVAVNQ